MKIDRSITIAQNEKTTRDRIDTYLREVGYERIGDQPDLIYERGSTIGSWLTFSPKMWRAKVAVQLKAVSDETTDILVKIDINTTGQLVTGKERRFWNVELDGLGEALQTGVMHVKAVNRSERSSLAENLIVAAVILGLMVGSAVVSALLFETHTAFVLGGVVGLGLGFAFAKGRLKF